MWNETTRRKYAPQQGWLCKRFNRSRVSVNFASTSSPEFGWQALQVEPSSNTKCNLLYAFRAEFNGGCLPRKDFPPASTVRYYFYRWRDAKILEKINNTLVESVRIVNNKDPKATVAIIDSQSVKTTSGGIVGYDAGKKNQGSQTANRYGFAGVSFACRCAFCSDSRPRRWA